jgi:hypothetical protein
MSQLSSQVVNVFFHMLNSAASKVLVYILFLSCEFCFAVSCGVPSLRVRRADFLVQRQSSVMLLHSYLYDAPRKGGPYNCQNVLQTVSETVLGAERLLIPVSEPS